jgi:hypothetical protein
MNQYIFWIDFWINRSSFDWCHELSWTLRYEYVFFIMNMNLWYVSQNTHANRVVLVFVHIVSEP